MNNAIPTISAAIATGKDTATTAGGDDRAEARLLEILQRRFKTDEKVICVFEAYQLINGEHTNRFLALAVSESDGTHAIFSFAAANAEKLALNDFTIKKIFALDSTFQIGQSNKGVSTLQFEMRTSAEEPELFYYYPRLDAGALEFTTFNAKIIAAQRTAHPIEGGVNDPTFSFSWLNDYREIGELKQELKRREHEFIIQKNFKVYCATWNVNNKPYNGAPLDLWLCECEEPPDIYAIALQELDMGLIEMTSRKPDQMWISKMFESLHRGADYEQLESKRFGGMQLTVFVRKEICPYISRCHTQAVSCSIHHKLGNKGGVAISLQLNEGNLCFVNSHLAAHMRNVEERNRDYAEICSKMIFQDAHHQRTLNEHDQIFWIGDLNYRIQEPPGLQLPMNRSDARVYEVLLPFDQLIMEMRKGNCYDGYTEGPITFRPTYKYDVGTDHYDSSEKQRAPAYCDRILWKGMRIEQLSYNSVMEIRQSDHKPVYALFKVQIKTKDEKLYKRVHEEVLKLVDKRENESQPQLIVGEKTIDLGEVRFNEQAKSDFTVSNICPMPVYYMFKVKHPPLYDICEKWVQVEPRSECLLTDTTKSIRVKMLVNSDTIRNFLYKMRTTNGKFDFDILILHVRHGPDTFIPVTGEYKPSCFGLSIETLCRTNRPLCEYTQMEIKQLMNDETPTYRVTMPREFFLLIDYLYKLGADATGVFSNVADFRCSQNVEFNAVRDWLDAWSDDEFPGTPRIAAVALLMLLDLAEKPLLEPFVEDLLYKNSSDEAMELVSLLSSPKRNVFVHLCLFLREGIEKKYYHLDDVASVFGSVLLRSENTARAHLLMQRILCSDMRAVSDSTVPKTAPTPKTSAPRSTSAYDLADNLL